MAMISLEIPAQLRCKIDIDDVRQGVRLKTPSESEVLEGRSAGENGSPTSRRPLPRSCPT